MKLTILGCLGGFPHNDEGTTSYLLEAKGYNLLIDCGSMAISKLEHFISPTCLDSVILSHYHHDHIADLGVLQYYRQLWHGKWDHKLLKIWGHTEDDFHFNDLTMENVSIGKPYQESDVKHIGPWDVTFLRTVHPVPCFAFRFLEKVTGKIFVFTGDTGYLAALELFAKDADLFLADTYLFKGNENHHAHLTSYEAGLIAKGAGVKQLVLTHLPESGNLLQLKVEAQQAAGDEIKVTLAQPSLQLEI
ncbi:MAG: MBL fold metallo-hydrolase [Streptococcaceae bacterium]|jgi:ribonuclease BN (tRNA processing enzyme)|nr:MBL fold metallo-hydrolase [Streptococcaceae bacterium]